MKVTYTCGPITFEQDCSNRPAAFAFIGALMEVFTPEPCGCCGKTNTAPSSRKYQENTFLSMKCMDCGAELKVIAMDDGRMFLGRKDKEKKLLPNKGWSVYQGGGQTASKPESGGDESEVPF